MYSNLQWTKLYRSYISNHYHGLLLYNITSTGYILFCVQYIILINTVSKENIYTVFNLYFYSTKQRVPQRGNVRFLVGPAFWKQCCVRFIVLEVSVVPHLKQSPCVISTSLTKWGLAVRPGSSLQASWKYNIIDFIIDDT